MSPFGLTKLREWGLIVSVHEDEDDLDIKKSDIVFLGVRSNPFPYMRASDIFVHQSRFEGEGMVLTEARLLCKPIVVTNFTVVNDRFTDRVNGSICQMDGTDIAYHIKELIQNDVLRDSYIAYLKSHQTDNSSEINKIYNQLES